MAMGENVQFNVVTQRLIFVQEQNVFCAIFSKAFQRICRCVVGFSEFVSRVSAKSLQILANGW
jgi:hypothetical protein